MPDEKPSLQERFAPTNRCFGCGPMNEKGLRIRSFPAEELEGFLAPQEGEVVCTWTPEPHHEAWDNMLNGGICGALLDCHSNWTAAWSLMRRAGDDVPPCTVTADFHVKLLAPTPTDGPLVLRARAVELSDRRATIEATLEARGEVTATCRGTFVAVREGHPAYHRW